MILREFTGASNSCAFEGTRVRGGAPLKSSVCPPAGQAEAGVQQHAGVSVHVRVHVSEAVSLPGKPEAWAPELGDVARLLFTSLGQFAQLGWQVPSTCQPLRGLHGAGSSHRLQPEPLRPPRGMEPD